MTIRKYDKELYPATLFAPALEAFSELAQIRVLRRNKEIICFFFHCKYDPKQTMNEFSNYLIDLNGVRGTADGDP